MFNVHTYISFIWEWNLIWIIFLSGCFPFGFFVFSLTNIKRISSELLFYFYFFDYKRKPNVPAKQDLCVQSLFLNWFAGFKTERYEVEYTWIECFAKHYIITLTSIVHLHRFNVSFLLFAFGRSFSILCALCFVYTCIVDCGSSAY